ncbi:hypothetical protein ACHWQZ_G010178 [Mnemiopsis leidyi]
MNGFLPLVLQLALLLLTDQASIEEGQSLENYLWEQTGDTRLRALSSNLIFGMREKCLDPSQFGGYMVDDTVYCYEGSESLGIAAKRSSDNVTLQNFLESEAKSWFGYWEWLNEIWHIKNPEGVRIGKEATAYMNHIRNVAENEIPVYTILALTPCARLWPWLGQKIGSGTRNFGLYTSWVETNLVPGSTGYIDYQEHVQWAYEAGLVTVEKALEIYTTSMQYEVDFFNSVERCAPSESNGHN